MSQREHPSHPMYKEEPEDMRNDWLYKRLLELEVGSLNERILLEAVKRSFGDYSARMDLEDY